MRNKVESWTDQWGPGSHGVEDPWGSGDKNAKGGEKMVKKTSGKSKKKMAQVKALLASAGLAKAKTVKISKVKAVASAGLVKAKTVKIAKVKAVASAGLVKAKSIVTVGARKVKSGTSVGIKWIKNQYQKKVSK